MKFIFDSFMLYFSERDLVSFVSILATKKLELPDDNNDISDFSPIKLSNCSMVNL